MHVLIAGGGLGGLTLAQTLRKQGISYEIFERDSGPDSRFQGWAIALHTYVSSPRDMFETSFALTVSSMILWHLCRLTCRT